LNATFGEASIGTVASDMLEQSPVPVTLVKPLVDDNGD
jgi:hypothetical protein